MRASLLSLLLVLCLPRAGAARSSAEAGQAQDAPDADGEQEAPASEAGLESLSLEELLALPVRVATGAGIPLTQKRTPGIVTVVTGEEIRNAGARDLIDVLRLVPGLQLGTDVQGVVGLGVRGLWGHEGKVLLLLDGQELNELMYGTTQLGNRYPVSQIERIEVIRGPGSVLYGGFAELAVVNIITKGAAQLQGFSASALYGQMGTTPTRAAGALSFGSLFGDLGVAAHLWGGTARRSTRRITGMDGVSAPLEDVQLPLGVNLGVGWRGLQARLLLDDSRTTTTAPFGNVVVPPEHVDFHTQVVDLRYAWDLGSGGVLTPRLNYRRTSPWQSADPLSRYDRPAERLTAGLTHTGSFGPGIRTLAGAEAYREVAHDRLGVFRSTGTPTLTLSNVALYAEASGGREWLTATAGVRYENHSLYPQVVVPRVAATSVLGPFHAKLLFSRAFRAPAVENLDRNPAIEPERTRVLELEAGWRLREDMQLTANVFDIRIEDPIVFSISPETIPLGMYENLGRTGSRGVELDYRVRGDWGYAVLNGAYSRAQDNQVPLYQVRGEDDVLVGLSPVTLSLDASVRLTERLRVSPSARFASSGFRQSGVDAAGQPVHVRYPAALLANLFVWYRDAVVRGLDVGVGVYDVLNTGRPFYQPYNNGYPPLPGPSREWLLRLDYQLSL